MATLPNVAAPVLVDVDEVVLEVGPKHPHMPPPIGPQLSTGRGQSRLGSGQFGGESCEQSESADTHAHVPFMWSHRQTRPGSHAPPHVPPNPSGWSEHAPAAAMTANIEDAHVVAEVSRTAAVSVHAPYPSALATAVASFSSAFAVHAGSGPAKPARMAFCRHFASAKAPFPTAFVFAAAHWASPVIVVVKFAKQVSTAARIASMSPTASQPPLASAFARATASF
jgi:hypothetical protein